MCFVYGAPCVEDKSQVWNSLYDLLHNLPHCLVLGDFNWFELAQEKLGVSPDIRGWDSFLRWRFVLPLMEVPFIGPTYIHIKITNLVLILNLNVWIELIQLQI